MQCFVPRHVVKYHISATGLPVTGTLPDGRQYLIPEIVSSDQVEVPSYFRESRGQDINLVTHAKLEKSFGEKTVYLNGILSDGRVLLCNIRHMKTSAHRYLSVYVAERYSARAGRRIPFVVTIRYYCRPGSNHTPYGNAWADVSACAASFKEYWGGKYFYKEYSPTTFSLVQDSSTGNVKGGHPIMRIGNPHAYFPLPSGTIVDNSPDWDWNKRYDSDDDLDRAYLALFDHYLDYLLEHIQSSEVYEGYDPRYSSRLVGNGTDMPLADPADAFLFNEVFDREFMPGPRHYWYQVLRQKAYVSALQTAPKMNDNNIANIAEIASFVYNLVVRRKVEIPKNLQSAWLAYRYSYGTGKQDVEDAIKFMRRTHDLHDISGPLKCYAVETTDAVMNTRVTCRCTLELEQKQLNRLKKVWDSLTTYGLTPSFYVIWDLIPYSFVIDWLIPVGDLLKVSDDFSRYSEKYTITNVCFSLKYSRTIGNYTYSCYNRWPELPLSSINEFYWLEKSDPSARTKIFRILDTVSLVTG